MQKVRNKFPLFDIVRDLSVIAEKSIILSAGTPKYKGVGDLPTPWWIQQRKP